MTNEELKKKIVDIVAMAILEADELPFVETAEYVADALIAAGIGDVKTAQEIGASATAMAVLEAAKAEHRAARAERALEERATYCAMEDFDYFSLTTVAVEARAKELYNGWVQQAEKELAEEGKDD